MTSYLQASFPVAAENLKSNYTFFSSKVSDSYNKFQENYPNISNPKTTITSTFNSGTEIIYSIPSSIETTVQSYTSLLKPVDINEREVTRTPPNQNLKDDTVTPLSDERIELVNNILDLYSCKLSMDFFNHYDPDVEFADLLMYTRGLPNLKAQFYAMPKLGVKSTTESYKIMENSRSILKIDLYQKYTIPYINRAVIQNSLIVLEFNDKQKIYKHTDLWNGREIGKEGILRKFAAKCVSTLVKVPEVPVPEVPESQ